MVIRNEEEIKLDEEVDGAIRRTNSDYVELVPEFPQNSDYDGSKNRL